MTSRKKPAFDVKKIESPLKDKIPPSPHPEILPKHPSRVLYSGSSRSGKTNLLLNLITRDDYLANYYQLIFCFSPTAYIDDSWQAAIGKVIPKQNVFTSPDPAIIARILEQQKNEIAKGGGVHGSPTILIIFDDCADDTKLLKSREFQAIFFRGRHYNLSTWICTQQLQLIPKRVRNQMSQYYIFRPNRNELTFLVDEMCPGFLDNDQFKKMVFYATLPEFSFFQINLQVPKMKSYRIGLNKIIDVEKMINNKLE